MHLLERYKEGTVFSSIFNELSYLSDLLEVWVELIS